MRRNIGMKRVFPTGRFSGGLTRNRVLRPGRVLRGFGGDGGLGNALLGPLDDAVPHRLYLALRRLLQTIEDLLRHADVPIPNAHRTHTI